MASLRRHRRENKQNRQAKASGSRPAPRHAAPAPAPKTRTGTTPKPEVGGFVEGLLQLKGRVGFVLTDNNKLSDVLIEGPSLKLAMDGDRVKARLTTGREAGRRYGQIVQVLARARDTVVGTFQLIDGRPFLVPEDEGVPLRLTDVANPTPRAGELAVARITEWPTEETPATGVLLEVLGERDLPGVDLLILKRKYNLPDAFPSSVEAEATRYGRTVPPDAYATRETYFDRRVFTIDGADAKDFDDAVSLEARADGGWTLGVHIADVSHYVREGSELDHEAFARGTSVYLKNTVLPMIPFPLSDNLCSLVPGEVRLTLSCIMTIDQEGRVTDRRLCETAIQSAKRFTYEEVERILKGETLPGVSPEIHQDVREMGHLAKQMRKLRFARGSLDFDFPEPEIHFDPHGRPVSIQQKMRLEAHKLIEDFMLAANENVARVMSTAPFLYRVHEQPDPAKIEKLSLTLRAVGVSIPKALAEGDPMAFQKVLDSVQGKPIERLVENLSLRSLKQAIYSPTNKGHFGLASKCYTHFTSPIRRYPDLIVHRLVKEYVRREKTRIPPADRLDKLTAIAAQCSKRERLAVEAEREFFDVFKVRLMTSHVGEDFTGIISGIASFGFFVQLDAQFVEGLVRLANIKEDFFVFDEVRMSLRGRRTGKTFQLGQVVKVKLAAANILRRQLDFELISPPKNTSKPKK